MLFTERSDREVTDRDVVARDEHVHLQSVLGEDLGGLGVAVDPGPSVGGHQGIEAVRVDVVGVLVGDDDGVQVAQVLEAVRVVPGVDQDPPVGDLDQQAGVSVVGQTHSPTVAGRHGIPDRMPDPIGFGRSATDDDEAPR